MHSTMACATIRADRGLEYVPGRLLGSIGIVSRLYPGKTACPCETAFHREGFISWFKSRGESKREPPALCGIPMVFPP